jgi:NADH-quinone oxidoreductase subunit A
MSQLLPVIVLSAFVLVFGCIILLVANLLGIKAPKSKVKQETYECGLESDTSGPTKVPIKFYLTAILFILFDIEIIFMYPWALTFNDFIQAGHGVYIMGSMGLFLLIFIIGLLWEVKSKALEWE